MIKAFIPRYKSEVSGSGKYHVYQIQVHCGSEKTYVEKRYSEFFELHKEIRKHYDTPCFPPKKVRNSSIKVLETRRSALENYIQALLTLDPIPKEVTEFLNLHSHFIRSEESISFYTIENRSSYSSAHEITPGIVNPSASFTEDPFLESDSSSNISDTVSRGVLESFYVGLGHSGNSSSD